MVAIALWTVRNAATTRKETRRLAHDSVYTALEVLLVAGEVVTPAWQGRNYRFGQEIFENSFLVIYVFIASGGPLDWIRCCY